MHLPVGTLLGGGKYKIEKDLGQGGFGITYLAEQTSLGRKVALKEFFMEGLCNRDASTSHVSVPSVGSKKLVERFKQKFIKEARMIASFDNSHIISIHDVFEENGTAYYVMEYLGGKSLSAIVNEQGIMSETLALKYIRQVADALAEVHANNLLHLDVKPANIMLNKKGEAVLIDFGISKHYDEAGNQTSSALIGTSEGYAPIEQYEAGALDSFTPATDIYALGATLFFLLTGTRPPKASEVMNYGLPELPSGVSASVRSTIETAMQPAIAKRPQSIAEFLCLVESGKMQDESDGETELNGNEEVERRNEKEHSAGAVISNVGEKSNSAGIEILPPFSRQNDKDGNEEVERRNEKEHSVDAVISNVGEKSNSAGIEILPPYSHQNDKDGNEEVERRNEKEHSVGVVISNVGEKSQSDDAVILNASEKSHSANNEILPPYSHQNDKDGKMKAASKREGENLFTHTASESSFDEVKVERRNEKEHSADAVISNESEKSQKNKPEKSLWLILLLLLIAVAGAWFLFSGTGNGNTPKTDTKKQIEKKDTPKEAGNTTDGNEASESSTGSGIDKEENVNGTAVAPNNNEEVKNFKENGICYNVTDKAKKTVEVAKGKYTGSIVIPETVVHNDVYYSVTSIGEGAFSGCKGLTSITIPNSVTSIGESAFSGCTWLTSITIPNGVTSIGVGAFNGCSGLTSITIPNSVTSIGDWAFFECNGLASITIPNSVTSIGDWAFYECNGLTSINISNSVTSIGENAFGYCSGLTSITIPNRVTSIGEYAFYGCTGLTSITIPNSVTSIGAAAFLGCKGLTSITIPNSVTSIGDYAFKDCDDLTNVIKPDGISIGKDAFIGTPWLKKQK